MIRQCMAWLAVAICLGWMGMPAANAAETAKKQYLFGFSQATTTEPWRILFNNNIRKEADRHPHVELLVSDARDDVKTQIAQVEAFIEKPVDLILISPKVTEALTPVVNKAYDAGIPVFVLDRPIANDRFTQFIGGDNVLIGRAVGEYVVELLGGPGKASGNIVEIWGGRATQASHDRHDGFYEKISKEPGIRILNDPEKSDGDWKHDKGYEIMADALDRFERIDLVYAHNDPMAHGAYLAAKDLGRKKDIHFIGVDGIPAEGVKWVHEGILKATFLYQTPGEEGIRQALKLLNGADIPKRVTLPTQRIDASNAEAILKENGVIP